MDKDAATYARDIAEELRGMTAPEYGDDGRATCSSGDRTLFLAADLLEMFAKYVEGVDAIFGMGKNAK